MNNESIIIFSGMTDIYRIRSTSFLSYLVGKLKNWWEWGRKGCRREVSVAEYELRIAPLLCDAERITLDIGADHGTYAMALCKFSAHCIAFEPRLERAAIIRERVLAVSLPIEIEPIALSDHAGVTRMRVLINDPGRSTIETANVLNDPDGSPRVEVRVPMLRLDDFELSEVGFIKIDVEGHELAVLKGAEVTIRGSKPNILLEMEERHCPNTLQDVPTFLHGLGYEGFFVLNGKVFSLAQFDKFAHQNPANIGGWRDGWQHRGIYVNNFFFLPAGRGGVLSSAVSSVPS